MKQKIVNTIVGALVLVPITIMGVKMLQWLASIKEIDVVLSMAIIVLFSAWLIMLLVVAVVIVEDAGSMIIKAIKER